MIFKINSGNCIIKADSETEARFKFANYVAGDLGIECFNVEQLPDDTEEVDYE